MAHAWTDIAGVTEQGGRPRLPVRPDVVAETLARVVASAGSALGPTALAEQVVVATGAERARVDGLLGWLPMSRVVGWRDDGVLLVHPETSVQDLGMRYGAWIGAREVAAPDVARVQAYAAAVVRACTVRDARPAAGGAPIPAVAAAPIPANTPPPLLSDALTERLRGLLEALDAGFVERRHHVRASLLGLIAGQHVLLLGPPGTAKSLLSRALCAAFDDAAYFEYLLSRFTHPDELFGPVSIPGLKEEDYRRLTTGFLPTAGVAFLDEIFKANSAILNSLLTLVNERVFHHGRHRDDVPLIGLIGASNELPDPDGGLAALYDRFLVRMAVPPVAGADAFLAIATGTLGAAAIADADRLTRADLEAIRAAATHITVPDDVAGHLVALWQTAQERTWEVSDRRWRQAVDMLKVAAVSDGRRELVPVDLMLLEPVLAPTPDQTADVRDVLVARLAPRSAPEHDLRAQWTLLSADRVAPAGELPAPPALPDSAPWRDRLVVRRASIARFLRHHRDAVDRLALDRERVEGRARGHLWLHEVPVELLSAHIVAARELAAILEAAEAYAAAVRDEVAAAMAALAALPQAHRRVYGARLGCVIHLDDAAVRAGIGPAGERHEPPRDTPGARPSVPEVKLRSAELLDWLDGRLVTEAVLGDVPAWGRRQALEAMLAVHRHLAGQAVPRPRDLPR